jgi:hypothetical protein
MVAAHPGASVEQQRWGLVPRMRGPLAFELERIHWWPSSTNTEGLALADLQSELLHRFLVWERGRNSQPKSINRRLHTLRLFYRFVQGHVLPGASVGRGNLRRHQRDHEMGLQRTLRPSSRQVRVKEPRTISNLSPSNKCAISWASFAATAADAVFVILQGRGRGEAMVSGESSALAVPAKV